MSIAFDSFSLDGPRVLVAGSEETRALEICDWLRSHALIPVGPICRASEIEMCDAAIVDCRYPQRPLVELVRRLKTMGFPVIAVSNDRTIVEGGRAHSYAVVPERWQADMSAAVSLALLRPDARKC